MKKQRPNKKVLVGTVTKDKMDKTVTVELVIPKLHPIYKKYVKTFKKIKAQDEKNEAGKGDLVKVMECRPISKEKSWRVTEIVEKAIEKA